MSNLHVINVVPVTAVLFFALVHGESESCLTTGCITDMQDGEDSALGSNLGLIQVKLQKEIAIDGHAQDDLDKEFDEWLENHPTKFDEVMPNSSFFGKLRTEETAIDRQAQEALDTDFDEWLDNYPSNFNAFMSNSSLFGKLRPQEIDMEMHDQEQKDLHNEFMGWLNKFGKLQTQELAKDRHAKDDRHAHQKEFAKWLQQYRFKFESVMPNSSDFMKLQIQAQNRLMILLKEQMDRAMGPEQLWESQRDFANAAAVQKLKSFWSNMSSPEKVAAMESQQLLEDEINEVEDVMEKKKTVDDLLEAVAAKEKQLSTDDSVIKPSDPGTQLKANRDGSVKSTVLESAKVGKVKQVNAKVNATVYSRGQEEEMERPWVKAKKAEVKLKKLQKKKKGVQRKHPEACAGYMETVGCSWTRKWNCPHQDAGSEGPAGVDNSIGYQCCCQHELWKEDLNAEFREFIKRLNHTYAARGMNKTNDVELDDDQLSDSDQHPQLAFLQQATRVPCSTGADGNPCQNGGTATGTVGANQDRSGCSCTCSSRFSGANCQLASHYQCASDKNYAAGTTPENLDGSETSGVGTQADCEALCESTSGCALYVYNNQHSCSLRSQWSSTSDADGTLQQLACYKAAIFEADDYNCESDKKYYADEVPEDMTGSLTSGVSDRSACAAICDGTPGCNIYVYTSAGACALKRFWRRTVPEAAATQMVSCYKPSPCNFGANGNVCQNGGTPAGTFAADGQGQSSRCSCTCLSGYAGANCETARALCTTITCTNRRVRKRHHGSIYCAGSACADGDQNTCCEAPVTADLANLMPEAKGEGLGTVEIPYRNMGPGQCTDAKGTRTAYKQIVNIGEAGCKTRCDADPKCTGYNAKAYDFYCFNHYIGELYTNDWSAAHHTPNQVAIEGHDGKDGGTCMKKIQYGMEYQLMPAGIAQCPVGSDITSNSECMSAYRSIKSKHNFIATRDFVKCGVANCPHVPYHCSVKVISTDQAPYWNTDDTTTGDGVVNGDWRMICKAKGVCKDSGDTIACAAGFVLTEDPSKYCPGGACIRNDTKACCEARQRCRDGSAMISCDAGYVLRSSDGAFCAGAWCTHSDRNACCESHPSNRRKRLETPNWTNLAEVQSYMAQIHQKWFCPICERYVTSTSKCPTDTHGIMIPGLCQGLCTEWITEACAMYSPFGYAAVGKGRCINPDGKSSSYIQTTASADNPYNCKEICDGEETCTSFEARQEGCRWYEHLDATGGDGDACCTCYKKVSTFFMFQQTPHSRIPTLPLPGGGNTDDGPSNK